MNQEQIVDELKYRISTDLAYFSNSMPERNAIAWRGYLAALLEWNVIDLAEYSKLTALLPPVPDDPVSMILLGRESYK